MSSAAKTEEVEKDSKIPERKFLIGKRSVVRELAIGFWATVGMFSFSILMNFPVFGMIHGGVYGVLAARRHAEANPDQPFFKKWSTMLTKVGAGLVVGLATSFAVMTANVFVPFGGGLLATMAGGAALCAADKLTSIGSNPKTTWKRFFADIACSMVPGVGPLMYAHYKNNDLSTGKALPGVGKSVLVQRGDVEDVDRLRIGESQSKILGRSIDNPFLEEAAKEEGRRITASRESSHRVVSSTQQKGLPRSSAHRK